MLPYNVPLLWIDINTIIASWKPVEQRAQIHPEGPWHQSLHRTYDADWMTLEIYNNGPPNPPNVYKRFSRSLRRVKRRTGLGLGLVL
jgi:hypothetical protein